MEIILKFMICSDLLIERGLILSNEQKDILDEVTGFNISVRYEDYKKEFRNKCTVEFAKEYIDKIEEFRKWIKKKL